jgi:hypothetical protein
MALALAHSLTEFLASTVDYQNSKQIEVAVNLRPTVSRPVCLGVGREDGSVIYCTIASGPLSIGQSVLVSDTRLGPATNFSFSLKFSVDSCVFVIL